MQKSTLVRFGRAWGIGIVIGFIGFALLGYLQAPGQGRAITDGEAQSALNFSFQAPRNISTDWEAVGGFVVHSWLTRKAYVYGNNMGMNGARHSEQVLKVGWPFTMVRGFVRVIKTDISTEGAYMIGAGAAEGPVRLLPLQPVWPGMIINSLLIGALFLSVSTLRRKSGSKE